MPQVIKPIIKNVERSFKGLILRYDLTRNMKLALTPLL